MAAGSSPVSLKVDVSRLPAKGVTVKLEADADQRAALCAEHGLEAVDAFSFELLVAPWKRDGARVTGKVIAKITQACVVTLDPVESMIDEDVSAVFVPEDSRLAPVFAPDGELHLDAEGEDTPETFSGNRIDAGALAEEYFALAIDPYPRREGVELPDAASDQELGKSPEPPFAKLRSLVRKP